jgi:hypothetical protein
MLKGCWLYSGRVKNYHQVGCWKSTLTLKTRLRRMRVLCRFAVRQGRSSWAEHLGARLGKEVRLTLHALTRLFALRHNTCHCHGCSWSQQFMVWEIISSEYGYIETQVAQIYVPGRFSFTAVLLRFLTLARGSRNSIYLLRL